MSARAPEPGAAPPALRPDDTFRQAARAAMWPQVRRMVELEPALRDVDATDDLKRYRVATRRLRAAIRIFEGALPKRALREIAPELGELARLVGRVRDLDVRIGGLPADVAVNPIREAWASERAAAAQDVEQGLQAKRHARLRADLERLVAEPDDAPSKRGRALVRDRAGSAVWAGFERLRAAAADLDGADTEQVHDLRIRAKRLRYTLEFLAPVLGHDTEWLIGRLVELQDHLGALHDADLAAAAARSFLDSNHGLSATQRAGIEAYAAAQISIAERTTSSAPRAAANATSPMFARRLSRAVLGPDGSKATSA